MPAHFGHPTFGPFASVGVIAWAAWLVAACIAAAAPGRCSRSAVGVALALTIGVVPAIALAGLPRPPLYVLLPQVALGVEWSVFAGTAVLVTVLGTAALPLAMALSRWVFHTVPGGRCPACGAHR